jgi:hypothetical protein
VRESQRPRRGRAERGADPRPGGPAQEGERQSAGAAGGSAGGAARRSAQGRGSCGVAVQLRRERLGRVQAAERTAGAALLL